MGSIQLYYKKLNNTEQNRQGKKFVKLVHELPPSPTTLSVGKQIDLQRAEDVPMKCARSQDKKKDTMKVAWKQ